MIGKWIEPTMRMVWNGECGSCEVLCSNCKKPAIDKYKFCPNCGSDNRKREDKRWNNAEVIINNLQELLSNYEEYKDEEDCYWWFDEYGSDLTWMIDCHPVFSDSSPCLNDERGNPKFMSREYNEKCKECKARWLLEVFE